MQSNEQNARPSITLVSGYTDLSDFDFEEHYIPQINAALTAGHQFILGDAAGADTQALTYLLSDAVKHLHGDVSSRIIVYPSRKSNIPKLQEKGVKVIAPDNESLEVKRTVVVVSKIGSDRRRWHHIQRDANMTAASDYDILYVRTEQESKSLYGDSWKPRVSATEMNRLRRAELTRLDSSRSTK